jgi:hypothetical protein
MIGKVQKYTQLFGNAHLALAPHGSEQSGLVLHQQILR